MDDMMENARFDRDVYIKESLEKRKRVRRRRRYTYAKLLSLTLCLIHAVSTRTFSATQLYFFSWYLQFCKTPTVLVTKLRRHAWKTIDENKDVAFPDSSHALD
jgi:hypothetical protein